MDFWDITRDTLYALAAANTPKLLRHEIRNMIDVLNELLDDGQPLSEDPGAPWEKNPIYVLSNQLKLNGSSCILYPGLLKEFAESQGIDLYILPSSVHEVLLLPASAGCSYDDLSEMVRDVNRSQLSREEVLSDHVYYFSKDTGQISMQ